MLPHEVLLEEFYRSEYSETVRFGRVRVFEELLTMFNCSVLTFRSAIKFHREIEPMRTLQYNILQEATKPYVHIYNNCIHLLATVSMLAPAKCIGINLHHIQCASDSCAQQ
jgi:hypothetical protein